MSRLHAFTSYGPVAGSTRVRVLDWSRHLGLPIVHHPHAGLGDNRPATLARHWPAVLRAEAELRRFDPAGRPVLLARRATPFGAGAVEERLLRQAERGVYDIDDALFADTGTLGRPPGRETARRAAASALVVVAGNDYLADWASGLAQRVEVIPSCVQPDDYSVKRGWALADPPSLVWLGSPATERFVAGAATALREVHRRTGARLRIISGPRPRPDLAPLAAMVDRVPWSPGTVASELARGDVAIAPLPDTPFTRGKCAYKVLQYAAAGLPAVGSPVGANRPALHRLGGVAATGTAEWVDALCQLLAAPVAERRRIGVNAVAAVCQFYSFAAWERAWCGAVLGLTPREAAAATAATRATPHP